MPPPIISFITFSSTLTVHNQVRNLGDGFDDEECPERESWGWEMRSTRAPGVGIFITGTRSEPDPFKSGKKAWEKLGR